MEKEKPDKREFSTRDRWLTFALFVGPLAALIGQLTAYSLVPTACVNDSKRILHVTMAAFLVVALSGAAIGWRVYNALDETEGVLSRERARWVAMVAMVMSIMSAAVLVAMEIPNLILRSCD